MAFFSKFEGDNNKDLYEIQNSILSDPGGDSAIPLFLRPSISLYKKAMHFFELNDEITRIVSMGCPYKTYNCSPFIEIIEAYYRYIWGRQYYLDFPGYNIPKEKDDWIDHYKKFLIQEGNSFSEWDYFFPSIIHLLAVQGLGYFFELRDHLLLIMNNSYTNNIRRVFDREISFLSPKQQARMLENEDNFVELNRDQIIELIIKNKTNNMKLLF